MNFWLFYIPCDPDAGVGRFVSGENKLSRFRRFARCSIFRSRADDRMYDTGFLTEPYRFRRTCTTVPLLPVGRPYVVSDVPRIRPDERVFRQPYIEDADESFSIIRQPYERSVIAVFFRTFSRKDAQAFQPVGIPLKLAEPGGAVEIPAGVQDFRTIRLYSGAVRGIR